MVDDSINVLGEPLRLCATDPTTGFYRNGCCDTGPEDVGSHTVCAVMTAEFLAFSKQRGNDLSTPRPEFGFQGADTGGSLVSLRASLAGGVRSWGGPSYRATRHPSRFA